MRPYHAGTLHAAARLGLVKQAADTYVGPDGEALPFWRSVGAHSKRWLLGKPEQYWQELKSGTTFSPGTHSRSALWPSMPVAPDAGVVSKAFSKALPFMLYAPSALQLAAAVAGPAENRGEGVGSAVGGAVGTALGLPLGILGSSAGSLLGSAVGGRVGRAFDSDPPAPKFDYDPRRSSTLVTD